MDKFSYLGNADTVAIEELFNNYLKDPNSVEKDWQQFFAGFEFARKNYESTGEIPQNLQKEFNVVNLINGYRIRGHLFAKINPIRARREYKPTLAPETFGLTAQDLETEFQAGEQIGIGKAKLKNIIAHLEQTYCQTIGAEYMYIRHPKMLDWLQIRMEKAQNTPAFTRFEKLKIFQKLNQAVLFENFLHTKFVGQKRFSLEGAESAIPAIDVVCEKGADLGIQDFVIGMAHRGRLNILTNVLNKKYEDVFTEFEGHLAEESDFDGDVKYHMGYSSDRISDNGNKFHMSLTPNPSHLEAVNPVVEGISRAKIDMFHNDDLNKVCPILIHGDGALAGQGIGYEVLQMSLLEGYKTGGTIHVVINNQIGFTTEQMDARSSTYCTDVAKVALCPVFHVNGDDVEALVYVTQMAMEFRQTFHRDVFIDVVCFRKHGHNEGDEPRFTQPNLYKAIASHPNTREIYVQQLISQKVIDADFAKNEEKIFREQLQNSLDTAKKAEKAKIASFLKGQWDGLKLADGSAFEKNINTKVDKKLFLELAQKSTQLPEDKKFFVKAKKLFDDRQEMIKKDAYDWAMGELMAYATLMQEGHNVRFTGQDVERGTFSHRHAVVRFEDTEERYVPLNQLGTKGKLKIFNSLLSEYGVLGFEFGYSMAAPNSLTIWEAQFGDFFNGAQIIIDQFITSAEYKWRRMSGLVMLLPHGYEGMGPEHSSARMERFLTQCAENNMQIVNCTTPANQFHVLRRQLKRDFRKPLICFTPKKLLRYPTCVSALKDFTDKDFEEVLDDTSANPKSVKRIAFCTGKIYYDLLEAQQKEGASNTAIVRIEQLYPLPKTKLQAVLDKYKAANEYLWVQEEPENMGAWAFILRHFNQVKLKYVGRNESASPATGYGKLHTQQQQNIINSVFEKQLVTK
jgi:2-oxoglutarate dehydrogenase E1 component